MWRKKFGLYAWPQASQPVQERCVSRELVVQSKAEDVAEWRAVPVVGRASKLATTIARLLVADIFHCTRL